MPRTSNTTLISSVDGSTSIVDSKGHGWILARQLFDGKDLRQDVHMIVAGGRIQHCSSESPQGEWRANKVEPDVVIDDQLVMPCLIEAHAHIHLLGSELNFSKRKEHQSQSTENLKFEAQKRLRELARFGITNVRDGGDVLGIGLGLSHHPQQDSAQLYSPGAGVNRLKRYGSFFAKPLEDFSCPEACVNDRLQKGARHLKLVVSGIINFEKSAVTGKVQFSAEDVASLVGAAHKKGYKVMAHASGEEGIASSVLGGVDTLEHGFFMTPALLEEMARRGTVWVPTFAPVQAQVDFSKEMGWSPEIVRNLQGILDHHAAMVRKAQSLGVMVLAGSDAGSIGVAHGMGLLWEMELLERAGMKPLEVLRATTGTSGHALFSNPEIGTLQVGSPPTFMLVSPKVTQSLKALRESRTVVLNGVVQKAHQLIG